VNAEQHASFMEEEQDILDFTLWLESINFVDQEGIPVSFVLKEDESTDPENDRGEDNG